MVTINLFPWREQKKNYERESCKKLLLNTFLITLTLIILPYGILSLQANELNSQVMQLKVQIHALQTKIPISHAENGKALQQINSYQTTTQHLLQALTKTPLSGVCFSEIKREKNKIIFSGKTQSALDLTLLLQDWPITKLFSSIQIDYLQQNKTNFEFRFHGDEINSLNN